MIDVLMDESKIFDACALIEEVVKKLTAIGGLDDEIIKKASVAQELLNQALEESKAGDYQ